MAELAYLIRKCNDAKKITLILTDFSSKVIFYLFLYHDYSNTYFLHLYFIFIFIKQFFFIFFNSYFRYMIFPP